MDENDRAEQIIRQHAAHLGEHPRCAWTEVSKYPPVGVSSRTSIHLSAAFSEDDELIGVDHAALAVRVVAETGFEIDPEYTRVFHWTRRGVIVYWWDWRLGERALSPDAAPA